MRFRRALFVFNPVAGAGAAEERIPAVRDGLLREAGEVHLAQTESPNHAAELARQASEDGYDLLAVQGGDGTVNEAVQGLAGRDSPALLVLPGGTANVLIHEVGLPTDPLGVIAALPGLVPRPVPLGLVELDSGTSRFFLVMCGAGLDAEIAAVTTSGMKNRIGLAAFWLHGAVQVLRRFPQLRVASPADAGASSGASSLVVISKSRAYGGGLVLTPGANLLADRLAVADFTGTSRIRCCGYLLAGVCAQAGWWPGIRHTACEQVRLEPCGRSPVQVQVDGEVVGRLPARVSLLSKTLNLLLPPGYGAEWLGTTGTAA